MGELNFCTIPDIFKATYEGLIGDLSLDKSLPYLLSRFFHNKILAAFFQTLRCYFLYFDTKQLGAYVPLIFLPFIIYAFINPRWRKPLIMIQLLLPLFFILNLWHISLQSRINLFGGYYELLGIIGGIKFLLRKRQM